MIICSHCGQGKTDYNFFRYINRYDKSFFVSGIPQRSDICFECAGPYRCLSCGEIKDANHFRVMGRICDKCKSGASQIPKSLELLTSKVGLMPTIASADTLNAENALKSGVTE